MSKMTLTERLALIEERRKIREFLGFREWSLTENDPYIKRIREIDARLAGTEGRS